MSGPPVWPSLQEAVAHRPPKRRRPRPAAGPADDLSVCDVRVLLHLSSDCCVSKHIVKTAFFSKEVFPFYFPANARRQTPRARAVGWELFFPLRLQQAGRLRALDPRGTHTLHFYVS